MHRLLTRLRRPGCRPDERGAVAIIVALSLTSLLVVAGMVLDFGLVRIDRQVDKSAADSATLAGLHALDTGDGIAHPYVGVCTAVRYLKANSERFSTINESTGWTNGLGTSTGNGCSDVALRNRTCSPTDKTSWAKFHWADTWQNMPLEVTVESGYDLAGNTWSEDSLPASSGDTGDSAQQGCDHLAVTVTQSRKPGLGSLATSSDLVTAIRSVGRVEQGPGGNAPAMLLLKQSGCAILTAGAAAGGSKVGVMGALSPSGAAQAGTIHADSDGSGCGSNENIYTGQAADGIVAYAAPKASNPNQADPSKPGQITAYAASLGLTDPVLRDGADRVCGAAGVYPGGTCPGSAVTGRTRVYREPVDERYLKAVQRMRDDANGFFAATSTMTQLNSCNPTQAEINAITPPLTTGWRLHINCTHNNGFSGNGPITIKAETVVFAGSVKPSAQLSLPNATRVYVVGASSDAIALGNGGGFSMHTKHLDGSSNLNGTTCSDAPTGTQNKAVLVVKNGGFKQTSGSNLQLCYTTVLMMGGSTDACLPMTPSTDPPNPTTPCGGTGTGQLTQTGGNVDWTAPNRYDVMTLPNGKPDPARATEWGDPEGPEDLVFWSESGGGASNPKYQMTGGGTVHLVGVLMTPNAQPFNLSGQFSQTLFNAQYIASSISLSSNNTQITMRVDPDSAVTLPKLQMVGLVR
jgi:hypothetical protein